ncbi:hypothetical protein [Mycolicibacterium sp. NCC-Tsukiji]|uniref:hypothetical protein n=1 Tax=Mycolicibacterium sp. NCC-Tsukiji TaxID=2185272 RepID=UPI000EDED1A9|nr:hypothetical protein [Mycolicibacterium sp. NCC-Tsukiji]GCB01882.1 hypothetical protein NCCNTM_55160 [Mycolicibacterium sp. NCC-Tsukiji]
MTDSAERAPRELIEIAYEAVRSFNHRTFNADIIPPEAYSILGEARALTGCMPQALSQLTAGLQRALRTYDVYDHNRDPVASVAMAAAELAAAGALFQQAYAHLDAAQTAINYQGVNDDDTGGLRRRPQLRQVADLSAAEHWQAWLERYGDDYATDEERRAAYRDFHANLAEMRAVFSQSDDMHVAGYLEAHERVSSGDADSPDEAELWVPANLSGPARADWLEGFRSHFEPRP